ncbi:hypothetical protein ALP72_03102 [Pseudomonas coronafaciens pv. coronafaciens]|nr:hypothetical protein ALP72_03102 [Pseudomonas coronafaciens pv. coronafaciens]
MFYQSAALTMADFAEPRRLPAIYSASVLYSSVARFIMTTPNSDPLHGVTLEQILRALVEHYEWSGLAERIDIRCFKSDPSMKSSLTFLRKTPWAREKVEALYVKLHRGKGW